MSRIEGLDRLSRKLKLLPEKAVEAAARSLEESAEDLVQMMRRLVPKDSGDLAKSIGWTWGDAPKGAMVLGTFKGKGGVARAKSSLQITIYAGGKGPGFDAFYARWVEFGTQPHALYKNSDVSRNKNQGLGTMHPGASANPFFFPSYRMKRRTIRSKLTRDVKKAIKGA